jgi:hypothetical protein
MTFTVTGCNLLRLAGATVSIWTDSSKAAFKASGVTSNVGVVTVDVPPTFYYEVTHPRFVGKKSGSRSCSVSASNQNVDFSSNSVVSGYYCTTWCGSPLKDTLHYSDPIMGAVTLSNSGSGGWIGTTSHTFSAGTSSNGSTCAGATVTVKLIFFGPISSAVRVEYPYTTSTRCAGGPNTFGAQSVVNATSCVPGSILLTPSWSKVNLDPVASDPTTIISGALTE